MQSRHLAEGTDGLLAMLEIPQELLQLLAEIVERRLAPVPLQGMRHRAAGARSPADAEIDSAGEQTAQHAERLSDFQGAIVRQHHAAGPYANLRGCRSDRGDDDLGAGARQPWSAMMLRQPIPVVAEFIG